MHRLRVFSWRSSAAATLVVAASLAWPAIADAQTTLGLQQAVDEALQSRASLRAAAQQVAIAEGARQQAGAHPNPDFQFQNENLRRGQTYTRDVDTLAVVTQPLDVLGKRTQRVAAAEQAVARAKLDYDAARLDVVQHVTRAYWEAREAQEVRQVLKNTVENFRQILDYHEAQLRVGTIAEQDVLRVRLENERLAIASGVAALDATRTRLALFKEMGRTTFFDVVLTESLDSLGAPRTAISDDELMAKRIEVKTALNVVTAAEANGRLQVVNARPNLDGVFGFKRTQLPDTAEGANTFVAGFRLSLPFADRNLGNRAAAFAELRQAHESLSATQTDIRNEYHSALEEYTLRRDMATTTVLPLREHAANIADLAQAAYTQGGTDLLRLLDARRARLDADLAWVHAMADYQQSLANLMFAEGAIR